MIASFNSARFFQPDCLQGGDTGLSSAASPELSRLKREMADVLSLLREPLFEVARVIEQLHARRPFTSLIIEERAGRFIGLFLSSLLGFNSDGGPFGLKPDDASEEDRRLFKLGVQAALSEGGSNPLIVSEAVVSGNTARLIRKQFLERGISPVYASALFEARQYRAMVQNILSAGRGTGGVNNSLVIYAPGGLAQLELQQPEIYKGGILVLGRGINFSSVETAEHEALNSLALPNPERVFLSGSVRDYWLNQSRNDEDRRHRLLAIDHAAQVLSNLLADYRATA